ncbi:hypothetical protein [Bacillus paramycoides]|uniref:Group-specific protein n=1 Tax=Bacillus paramycoides TaxID=2026194 RepID=A0ABU6MZ58_9BACI|nr:hypothetical protein [Bacillus paramycoides]MED1568052.1 hypothetical protein [Bacillus paramycoides]
MYIFILFKALVQLILIGLILLLSIIWVKIETFLNDTLFKGVSKKVRNSITMIFVILIESFIIFVISLNWGLSFIDTLFVGSFIILSYIWLVPYFVNHQQNVAKIDDKHFSGNVDIGEVEVYQAKFTPFSLGSTFFSIIGIIINVCYYYKYFL